MSSINVNGPAGVIMAAKQMQQQKIEGNISNQLIQSAANAAPRSNPFGNISINA